MFTLFEIADNGMAVLHPNAYKLMPALKDLTQEELLYIIKVWDYHSPLRRYPLEDRKRLSAGDSKVNFETKRMAQAVEMYRALQYDSNRELLQALGDKREQLMTKIKTAKDTVVIKITKAISDINKIIEQVNEQIEADMQGLRSALIGGGKLSLIEEEIMNKNLQLRHREDETQQASREMYNLLRLNAGMDELKEDVFS